MIRQNINLGLHTYICDLYKAEDDLKRSVQREFVMLRRYDITDDIVYDTDIYFVEKSIINDVVSNLEDNTKIVWPIPGNVGTEFNANYTEYNSNFSEYTFKKDGDDLHKLYREFTNTDGDKVEFREAEILCDKIRIYHPQTKVDLDYVIYIDNYINDIHFHYYCQKVSNLETYTEDEFRYGTNIYSEFVEFYIPNIEDIISKDVFFKEDMNTLSISDSEFVNQYKNLITEINITHDQITAYEKTKDVTSVNPIPVYTDDNGIKWHLSEFEQTEDDKKYNIVHKPVYHAIIRSRAFEDLVANDPDYYGLTTGYESVISNVYYEDLLNKEGWEPIIKQVILNSTKAKISESNEDTYPNMPTYHEVDETKNTNTVLASSHLLTVPFMIKKISDTEGYEKIYLPEVQKTIENNYLTYPICLTLFPYSNVNENGKYELNDDYPKNSDIFMEELRFTLGSRLNFVNDTISIINEFNYPNKSIYKTFKEAYEHYNNISFSEYSGIVDYNEEEDEEIEVKQCAFHITIASDTKFKQVIYSTYFEANEADDFSFSLNNIFDSWKNMPEFLICKVKFVDRYLGTVINGNNVVITKEYYKYCVNEINHPRIHQIVHRQINYNIDGKIEKDTDMNLKDINFIDKINCIVTKPGDSQTIYNVNNKPKIIYKPIFYRVQDLQNIYLHSGMSQNVGINLADYMTKVETFKLVIDGNTFVEIARNDIFTIFKIDTTTFSNTSGTYHILNEEDEYISSGNWAINE